MESTWVPQVTVEITTGGSEVVEDVRSGDERKEEGWRCGFPSERDEKGRLRPFQRKEDAAPLT